MNRDTQVKSQSIKAGPDAGGVDQARAATILIVDDDPLVLDLLVEFLGYDNFGLVTAGSGEEALAKLKTVQVDIALVDFKMPGMDGIETIERIAEIDPDIIAIIITAFPTIDSSIKAIKLGASDYLLKPFKLDEVKMALDRAIEAREVRLEVNNLRKKISELEKGLSGKKENIKLNQKLNILNAPQGYKVRNDDSKPSSPDIIDSL